MSGGLREPFVFRDGEYDLPAGPGLGIELDEEWVRAHAVDRTAGAPRRVTSP